MLVCAPVFAEPNVISVEPSQGVGDEDTDILVTGEGFDLHAGVRLDEGGPFEVGRYEECGGNIEVAGACAYMACNIQNGSLQIIDIADPRSRRSWGSSPSEGRVISLRSRATAPTSRARTLAGNICA